MLLNSEQSLLLVVDVQERLMPAILDADGVAANVAILVKAAKLLNVPVLATEHYPKGLGPTVAPIRELLPPGAVVEKISFSAVGEPSFLERLERAGRRQILLAGAETHVCVMQTALSLRALGYDVALAADASSSRKASNVALGHARLRANGVEVVSTEMAVFEWLGRGDAPAFKSVLSLIK
ncbi:hydrolase [Azospirillum rugosum]|uniref:Nicotinamidase-related amidase n=1 Tax=Azospirillum rugosum TaxID=416170 RepID=A0ABS4SDE0_9PROT|nr:hydrolase [Azospirillum rugosum]MBP2290593.1 nicotinamidase-related amidase [Azospirillum rugosum]MDQ0525481.1 nicotinamidase-related amidase [Azospirillum rugosum]